MDIKNLGAAYSIKQRLDELRRQRDLISTGKGLGVTIQSTYQDDDFIAAIIPHAASELERRIAEKQKEMESLGVVFPESED
ncbi:hypothetical protein V8O11_20485 [Erwinia aphidicola]|uniref:hypothetical protein n=1 Tax=Erwinia aphidicola TaxID=68334 RepID=UPI00300D8A35